MGDQIDSGIAIQADHQLIGQRAPIGWRQALGAPGQLSNVGVVRHGAHGTGPR
ncbi:MAG: hypothetical protein AB9M53_00170 [Leptothrix sp. (in: b-proteobacteria)]